jgi:mannose-6-phosphate isomerase-like protein (cupin superfamily)
MSVGDLARGMGDDHPEYHITKRSVPDDDSGSTTEPRYDYWFDYRDIPVDDDPDWATRHGPPEFWSEHIKFNVWHIAPGEGSFLNYHEEPVREYYYLAEGKLDVRLADDRGNDEVITATAGTTVYLPGNVKHRPVNNYDEPAVLVVASGPPVSYDNITACEDEEIL